MRIATVSNLANNATSQIQLSYVPQFLYITEKSIAINVQVLGVGTIFDANTRGLIDTLGNLNLIDSVGNPVGNLFTLADGYGNYNTVINMINVSGNVKSFDVYAFSFDKISRFYYTIQQRVFANSGIKIENFEHIVFEDVSQNTMIIVETISGVTQNLNEMEINRIFRMTSSTYNLYDSSAAVLKNDLKVFTSLTYIPTQDTDILIIK